MDTVVTILVLVLFVVLVSAIVVVGVTASNAKCIDDCVIVGNTTYYSFPVSIDGQQCKAITKYGDGSGMVALNCKGK